MEIHQVLVTASANDAITNQAFELQRLFSRACPSDVYAFNIEPALAGAVKPLHSYAVRASATTGRNLLVFHAAIGEPEVLAFLLGRPEPIVLVYHNITPSQYFSPYDPQLARLLDEGRQALLALRDRVVLALADSAFNAGELLELGYPDVRVTPLILDVHRLASLRPDPRMAETLAHWPGPTLLFVGQLSPHKRPDLLVAAFHVLRTYLVPDARLLVVGPARIPRYEAAVRRLVEELNLHPVHFLGSVSEAELAACFRRADAFATMSEHEGFCVPLLEAMAFELPIVARAFAAVPDTLDGTGLLLGPDDGVLVIAEAMAEALGNPDLRGALVGRGHRRVEDFAPDAARAAVLEHVLSVV